MFTVLLMIVGPPLLAWVRTNLYHLKRIFMICILDHDQVILSAICDIEMSWENWREGWQNVFVQLEMPTMSVKTYIEM